MVSGTLELRETPVGNHCYRTREDLPVSSIPPPHVLLSVILLAFLTAALACPLGWGYCGDDRCAVMPKSLRILAISLLVRFVPSSVNSCSGEPHRVKKRLS